MNIFKRLFKIGESEAHSAIDKLENPIKLTEQGIRDLKSDLNGALQALAEVKAMAIRSRNEVETEKNLATDYQNKAMLLLKRAQDGAISAEDGDRLATEALTKKGAAEENAKRSQADLTKLEGNIAQLEKNIQTLRSNVSKWENELKTLKARVKVSSATKNLNKQMSKIDSSGTVSMLEKMKDKVAEEEALADAYGEIANESKSVDDEIEKALDGSSAAASSDLEKLKAQLNSQSNS